MFQALIETQVFQALLRKWAVHRAYKDTVDNYLAVLFCGFPNDPLVSPRQRLGYWGLVRQGQAAGTDKRICAVQVAVVLIRKIMGALSIQERQDLARAFLTNDASNPTYKGFKVLFQVVEQLNIPPAFVSYLNTEVAGQVHGMSQKEIFHSWVESQVDSVMTRLRQKCLEEAEFKSDLWQ
jgi:hypothetical protein